MDDRSIMVNISDHVPPTTYLRNDYPHSGDPSQMTTTTNRYRVGVSPVLARRSIKEVVPTAVVTPSPPYPRLSLPLSPKPDGRDGDSVYYSPSESIAAVPVDVLRVTPISASDRVQRIQPLAPRSRSSVRSVREAVALRRTLHFDEFEDDNDVSQYEQQEQEKQQKQRGTRNSNWLGDELAAERQAPSNSILTLHLPYATNTGTSTPIRARDESQERRLRELEARLRDIETHVLKKGTDDSNGTTTATATTTTTATAPAATCRPLISGIAAAMPRPAAAAVSSFETPKSRTWTNKKAGAGGCGGAVSVAVPPMIALDRSIFRVQPTTRSEDETKREFERMEKKLKQQEEVSETLRSQQYKQTEQLTRQLVSDQDKMQTLRSRIRELELENELWQNRFRLYNDVDVAKILRENERLRSIIQRYRRVEKDVEKKDNDNDNGNDDAKRAQELQQELAQAQSRCNELEAKYRSVKERHKEAVRTFRTRSRQDHIELEALKVTVDLQNSELSELRKRTVDQVISPTTSDRASQTIANLEMLSCNLRKCFGIIECLSKITTRIKRKEPLDVEEVLDYGQSVVPTNRRDQKSKTKIQQCEDRPIDESVDELVNKLTRLHSMVVDIYGDDLADAVSCNVQ